LPTADRTALTTWASFNPFLACLLTTGRIRRECGADYRPLTTGRIRGAPISDGGSDSDE
jgi:hypothetical protein